MHNPTLFSQNAELIGVWQLSYHRHHYLKKGIASTTLDNTMRYIKYILHHFT